MIVSLNIAILVVIIITIVAVTIFISVTTTNTYSNAIIGKIYSRPDYLRVYNTAKLRAPRTYDEYRDEINNIVETAIKMGEFGIKSKLTDACAYALRGGKRLRSIIVMEICRAAAIANNKIMIDSADAALGMEYFHTASIIIDDAPAFDDDSVRRDKPSLHVVNNTATAYMAALSLVSAGYQDINTQVSWIRNNCPQIKNVDNIGMLMYSEISTAMGAVGAAGGQFMDTTMSEEDLFSTYGSEALLKMIQLKTATFFEISFVCGWLVSGSNPAEIDDIRLAGKYFGTAYQLADDIGDMEQDANRRLSGKPGWNYANEYGKDNAINELFTYLAKCELIMIKKGIFTPVWNEIFDKVITLCD